MVVTSRPQITSAWRIEPNLAGRLDFRDTGTKVAGINMNLGGEVKSVLEPVINNQISALQSRLRSDPTIERTAREQWAKMCRSIALPATNGLPPLWLEIRPLRAMASQPRVEPRDVPDPGADGVDALARIRGPLDLR